MRTSLVLILSTATLAAFAPACKNKANDPPSAAIEPPAPPGSAAVAAGAAAPAPAPAPAPAAPAAPTPAPALTDPQIAAIVVSANQVDIDAGQLAIKKSKNEEVKKFAQRMVTDHAAVNKAAVQLVTKLKVTPEESDASRGLVTAGAESRANLEKLDGDAFDRAYVDNEVAYHKAVIAVLDNQLIPSATNAELKSTLVGVKPAFDAHLQHAEHVQATLAGRGSGDPMAHGHAK